MTESAPFLIDNDDVPALRDAVSQIVRIGYCETQVRRRLGLTDISDLYWRSLPIYRRERLSQRDALATAIDLFLLQGTISQQELSGLFCRTDQEVLIRAGILSIDGQGCACARASLFPVSDHLAFSEHAWPMLPHPGLSNVPHNQVMSVGADSHWLARATVRRPVDSALDLCTGSGIHALLAATHSQRVLAVDINPRAVACTHFNTQVLGITNVEAVVGDLFDSVGEERFDLITANPPFVPSPINTVGFRDGGHSGEDIQRRIVTSLPHHLAPGGIVQMVTELGERDGESLEDRLRTWIGNAPIDIHILRLREYSTTNYALGHAVGEDYATFLDSVDAWSRNLKDQGYNRIIAVLLAFQWSDATCGPPWTWSGVSEPPLYDDAGIEIEEIFATERLARHPHFHKILERGRIRRTMRIKLFEAGMLGDESLIQTHAQLLGKALAIQQWLNPIERELLVRLERALALSDILSLAEDLGLERETTLATLRSLLQRRLISLCSN
ncbi:S-adenosyl-l-methionine-dependent methyltransferase [Gammaproteobacteria bacterium]